MYRECIVPRCWRYAPHVVTSHKIGVKIQSCHGHLPIVVMTVDRLVGRMGSFAVHTPSAVVMGDLRAWRTRSSIAYDVFRQIEE